VNVQKSYSVRDPTIALLKLREDLIFTPDISADPPCYAIEDPLRGKFYRVGIPEFTFISLLDGKTSITNALGLVARKLGRQAFSENEGLALCRWLLDCQLAHTAESAQAARLCKYAEKNAQRRLLEWINPLMIKLPLLNPNRLLTEIGPGFTWLLSRGFFLFWCVVCLYALYLLAIGWDCFSASAVVILDRDNWLYLALTWLMLKLLHELAHGLTCKKYGGSVPVAGISLLFLAPLAYVDVTSSWRFRSKWHRIATAAAGMYVELFAAAIAVIFWSNTTSGLAHNLALNVAVMVALNTLLFNGNPLVRFDGYFIFSDLLEIPNLYPCGQQYLIYLIQKYILGQKPPLPNWPPRKAATIKVYAVAALAWRVLFFLMLALALVGMFAHFGALLAFILLGFGWGIPLIRVIKLLVRNNFHQPVVKHQLITTWVSCLFLVILGAMLLSRPGTVHAPAVVEYAPLTIIRNTSPGFVREIRVSSGDLVETGQIIAILENQELSAELADIQLAFEQSALKGRMYYQEEQLGKYQVERANQEALEKRMAEIQNCIETLTVRAPVRGHVFSRNLESLEGCYLQAGNEIAIIGDEKAKELLIAVSQDDVDLFLAHLGKTVDVHMRAGAGEWFFARLVKVSPCGSAELPHPAFAAPAGGPLSVRIKSESQNRSERSGENYELLTPTFLVKAELQTEQSTVVHAGQVATVKFQSPGETVGGRIFKSAQNWIQQQMATRQSK
jgi:putative peptide zinc metalloprotease protein